MKAIFLIPAFLLAACAPPAAVNTPVPVNIEVPVTCKISMPPEPAWNRKKVKASDSLTAKVKAGFADLDLADAYLGDLKAALCACQ